MFRGLAPLGDQIYNVDPQWYLQIVEQENRQWHHSLRGLLEPFITPYDPYSLVVVGSDGRMERHSKTSTDIAVLAQNAADYPGWDLAEYLGDHGVHVDQRILSVYDLAKDKKLSLVKGLQPKAYPDFLLWSDLVAGNPQIFFDTRVRIMNELKDKNIYNDIKDRNRRQYARAATTGIHARLPIFNRENCEQYYYEASGEVPQLGFKIPFLRLVQSWLDLETITYLRALDFHPEVISSFAQYVPSPVPDRVAFFGQQGWLHPQWEDIHSAYGWFLREYHYAQERYCLNGETTTTFDPVEFDYYSQTLLNKCAI